MRWTVQIALLAALLAFCLLQIPRKALFFTPRAVPSVSPAGAAFVELSDAARQQMQRQAHELAWSRQTRAWVEEKGSVADARVLEDPLPPPDPLPLPPVFRRVSPRLAERSAARPAAPLLPDSLAAPPLTVLPAPPPAPATSAADDLLDLNSYETLRERK